MKKKILIVISLITLASLLSGCDLLLFGGGAAGGYYVGSNYNITKKD